MLAEEEEKKKKKVFNHCTLPAKPGAALQIPRSINWLVGRSEQAKLIELEQNGQNLIRSS